VSEITLSDRIETGIRALQAIGLPTSADLNPTGLSAAEVQTVIQDYTNSIGKMDPWQNFLTTLTVEEALEAGVDFERAVLLLGMIDHLVISACQIISALQPVN
jgi:hypothetical protein